MTVRQFFKAFPSDDVCLDHVMACRYGDKPECPKCGKAGKFHRITNQPCYSCQWCGHHIHPCVGTPFEQTRTSLQLWFYAIYLFSTTRHGVSAKELQRQLGVTYKTAWRMGHEIRKYMAFVDGDEKLSGGVEIDETYFGGMRHTGYGRPNPETSHKSAIFGIVERDGDISVSTVPNVKK